MTSISDVFASMDYGRRSGPQADADAWLEQHGRRFRHFVAGGWIAPSENDFSAAIDPATGIAFAQVASCGRNDIAAAIRAASSAFPGWAEASGVSRGLHLLAIARGIERRRGCFVAVEAMETGRPVRSINGVGFQQAVRTFRRSAGSANFPDPAQRGYLTRGVIGLVFQPGASIQSLASWVAPALAAGASLVLVPTGPGSLTALLLAEVCNEVGLPSAVLNVLPGDSAVAYELAGQADLEAAYLVGSETAGAASVSATDGFRRVSSLRHARTSALVVFEDADLDGAVEEIAESVWCDSGSPGRRTNRVLVQESVEERFIVKLRRRMEALRTGDPLDPATDVGPLLSHERLDAIRSMVEQGVLEGAPLWQPASERPPGGNFLPPTLFTGCSPSHSLARSETDGPVAVTISFRTPAEAIRLVTEGLVCEAVGLWTQDLDLAFRTARGVRCSTVWINGTGEVDPQIAFPPQSARAGILVADQRYRIPKSHDRADVDGARSASHPIDGSDGELPQYVRTADAEQVRIAVAAAQRAKRWGDRAREERAGLLYALVEKLSINAKQFAARLESMTRDPAAAEREVELSIDRLFTFAGLIDRSAPSTVTSTHGALCVALDEPLGVIGVVCPTEAPLLGFISTVVPAVLAGNTVVAVPSEPHPLAAVDFVELARAVKLPAGVLELAVGRSSELLADLQGNQAVDTVWCFADAIGSTAEEGPTVSTDKRRVAYRFPHRDWSDLGSVEAEELLRKAVRVKRIWVPDGS